MENPASFVRVVRDMLNDITTCFPEYIGDMDSNLSGIMAGGEAEEDSVVAVKEHCKEVLPVAFFDILYENEELFTKDDVNCCFLPGIDFSVLWKENISDKTRKTMWKYLQLLLFSSIEGVNDKKSFGDAASLFNAISEEEFKGKVEETLRGMKDMFMGDGGAKDGLPKADDIRDHVNKMMGGKLGSIAREIAEETLSEMDVDGNMKDPEKMHDVFGVLLKDPARLMKMISTVGDKLDEKIKSGELKESEMLEEATEMIKNVNDMPGMEHIKEILQKMGMGSLSKAQMDKALAQMKHKTSAAKTRDRLREKLAQRNREANPDSTLPAKAKKKRNRRKKKKPKKGKES